MLDPQVPVPSRFKPFTLPSGFVLPSIHSYPPFFTLQNANGPVEAQLSNWVRVIVSFARFHRIWTVIDDGIQDWSDPSNPWHTLFHNPRIKRTLTRSLQSHIFGNLHTTNVFQREPQGTISLVFWESKSRWGEIMWDWIDKTGQINTILTAYELIEPDSLSPLKGAPISLLVTAINCLRESGRAQLIGSGEETGVRFLTPRDS